MFIIYLLSIPVFLIIMIVHYDKEKDQIMSNLKRIAFLEKLKADEEEGKNNEDIHEDNPWRKFEKEVGELFNQR